MVNRRIFLFAALMVMVLSAVNAADDTATILKKMADDTAAHQKKMREIATETCLWTCRSYYENARVEQNSWYWKEWEDYNPSCLEDCKK